MINYLNAAIFGIVQGLTEFLPVSSSGHLVILHEFLDLPFKNELTFDVILHLATLLAVIWYFKKDIYKLAKGWLLSLRGEKTEEGRLSWLIILGTIPAGLVGYFFEDFIETKLHSLLVVVVMLIVVGLLFIFIEKISKLSDDLGKLNWKKTLLIGFAQALALIPGTSRSGITIIAGLKMGLKREMAIKFSFLLSIPIILGASVKKIPDILQVGMNNEELFVLLIAFFFSYISGFFAIKYFLLFSRNHNLNMFAYYRFILAAVILIYFFV